MKLIIIVLIISSSMSFIFSNIFKQESDDFLGTYESMFKLGEAFKNEGSYIKAIPEFRRCLELAEKYNLYKKAVKCCMRLGLMYWNIGKLEKSKKFYEKAFSVSKKFGLNELGKKCRSYIGIYNLYLEGKEYRSSGKYQKSIESFHKAIELAKRMRSVEHAVKCLRQLSNVYWDLNDLKTFFSLNGNALKLARSIKHRKEEGKCLNNRGIYHRKVGNFFKSLSSYEESLRIAKETNSHGVEAECMNNIGNLYKNIGDYQKSLHYLLSALSIDKQLGNELNISIDLINIGEIFRTRGLQTNDQKDFRRALENYYKALNLMEKNRNKQVDNNTLIKIEVRTLNNIGTVFLHMNSLERALEYINQAYQKASKIQDFEAIGMILNNIGIIYQKLGNYGESIQYFQKSIQISSEIKASHILWEAYYGLGQCYELTNERLKAIDCYKKSLEEIDNIRSRIPLDTYKAGFLRDKLQIYESFVYLLYRLQNESSSKEMGETIFNVVEKAKARAFLEVLGKSQINIQEKLSTDLKNREKEISLRINKAIKQLWDSSLSSEERMIMLERYQQAENEYMLLLSRMRIESPEAANMVLPEPCHLKQIQKNLLDDKTAIIEYFLGDRHSFIFIIRKNSFDLFLLPPKGEIRKSIRGFIKMISDIPVGKFRGSLASKRLFQELLFPLEEILEDSIENLVIIPDGLLYYLPFETLITPSQEEDLSNQFLIERYKISYAPSCSSLLFLKKKTRKTHPKKSLLAFGSPIFNIDFSNKNGSKTPSIIIKEIYESQGFDFSDLPFSKIEIKKIARFFSPNERDIFLGNQAREGLLKNLSLDNYRVVHFACHGLIDERFPFRSALVLTLDKELDEDGFLLVREIYKLRFSADMVVLSACQTGKGKIENIEGVLGLPRIFFYCGAKSVVSSLWKINDKSTAKFMSYFYRHLSQGKDKAAALRMAKIKMLNSKYSHPFNWAAFVLYGDYSNIPILDW